MIELITVRHLRRLFAPFTRLGLVERGETAPIAKIRDQLAHDASLALLDLDTPKLLEFEAFLRGAFAVCLVNGWPTANLIESAETWGGKVRAMVEASEDVDPVESAEWKMTARKVVRGSASYVGPLPANLDSVTFTLTDYPSEQLGPVLLGALRLEPYGARRRVILDDALMLAREIAHCATHGFAQRMLEAAGVDVAAPSRTASGDVVHLRQY